MKTAFVADTNVVHWVDINSLVGDVFTTHGNLLELGRIPREKPDVFFLDETVGYFTLNCSNVLSDSHPQYGVALKVFADSLSPYKEIVAKHVIASCLNQGFEITDPRTFANHVVKIFRKRLRNRPDIYKRVTSSMRDQMEDTVTGFSVMAAVRVLNGEELHYTTEDSFYTDRRIVASAYVLPNEKVYVLSRDTDVKLLAMYAKLRFGGDKVEFVNSAESIPDSLKRMPLARAV